MSPHKCKQNDDICSFRVFNALSFATDIFERRKPDHAKRVAYTALKLAESMGMSELDMNRLFNAAILHDIGIGYAKNDAYQNDLIYEEANHVRKGADIVDGFFHDKDITQGVLYHHENYDGTGYMEMKGSEIPVFAKIIRLSDYLALIFERKNTYAEARKENRDAIIKQKGILFDPDLVDAFLSMSSGERFWLDYRHENFDTILERIVAYNQTKLTLDELIKIALIFSKMIDDKSKFTGKHSENIAFYIRETAKMKNYSEEIQKRVYIAGLLHDIGKVSVLSSILDKPGPLSPEERSHVKAHPYYTRLILDQIPNLEDITEWASNHHEFLDGSGYPEPLKDDQLDYFSRIITVIDIYEALNENRPYRKAYGHEEAWKILNEMRDNHILCPIACADLKVVTDSANSVK